MERKNSEPNFIICVFLYYCIVMINIIIYYNLVDFPKLMIRMGIHKTIIDGTASIPHQYRILIPYLSELMQRAGTPFKESYVIIRAITDFLGAILLHLYLKKWFDTKTCVIGVLFYLGTVPLVYTRSLFQSIDSLNLLFFLIGYIIIRDRRDIFLFPLLLIAMFNRETSIMLILVYLFYRYDELKIKQLGINVFSLFVVAIGTYIGIRLIYAPNKPYCDFFYFLYNFKNPLSFVYMILFFNIFLLYAWTDLKNKPKFLRRSSLMIPFFVVIHWTISIVQEIRLFMPLIPIILPLGLISIFGTEKKENEQINLSVNSCLTKYPHIFFIAFCFLFIIFFYFFCHRTSNLYHQ